MSTHICTHMTSVNISLRKEAYEFLKSLKTKDASFSDIILGFKKDNKGNKKEIMKYFGALKDMDIDWEAKEKRIKEFRKSFDNRVEEIIKYKKNEK